MDSRLSKVVLVIPSLNPDDNMVNFVNKLIDAGFSKIVIVDDGSRGDTQKYFDIVSQNDSVTVLKHAINQGKGRALKTAFNYILNTYTQDEIKGVVTADADGQHSPLDTKNVAIQLVNNGGAFVLGTRYFNDKSVPFKSSFGNRITSFVFGLMYGRKIADTQTGLRGIPYDYLKKCLILAGERFEYEILMLIDAVNSKMPIIEEKIQTIYINSNRETHFDAIKDSARIYRVMFECFF
jgi:dolichol-phosphate mannosyltransferase